MEPNEKTQESGVSFAQIPRYLMQEINDLEQEIYRDTGKSVTLVAYEMKTKN